MVRLLDFGLAQFDGADTLTAAGDVPGTLAYIAPERLAGAEATPESDVWAVGVLLWEALAGKHPFWGVPLQEVARAIEAGAPPSEQSGAIFRASFSPRSTERWPAIPSGDHAPRHSPPTCEPQSGAPHTTARRPKAECGGGDRAPPARPPRRAGGSGAVTALLGATLLPFWPGALVAAIVLGAGLAAWIDPRAGLAIALPL